MAAYFTKNGNARLPVSVKNYRQRKLLAIRISTTRKIVTTMPK